MEKNQKNFQSKIQLKAEDEGKGQFTAVFSTFNVVDHDRDVTLPGAFTEGQKVRISYWGHRWHDLPVGRGVIHADNQKAWVDGQLFLETEAGRETYETLKGLDDLAEFSYGFDIEECGFGKFEDQDVRFLNKLNVFEVSPVMLGAGIDTRLLAIKAIEGAPAKTTPASAFDDPDDGTEGEAGDGKPSGVTPDTLLTQIEILEMEE